MVSLGKIQLYLYLLGIGITLAKGRIESDTQKVSPDLIDEAIKHAIQEYEENKLAEGLRYTSTPRKQKYSKSNKL